MSGIFVVGEHLESDITETTFELLAIARELAAASGGPVTAGLIGSGVTGMADRLGGADRILIVDDPGWEIFNPEGHSAVFASLIAESGASVILVPYTSTGMDVSSYLAEAMGIPLVSFCTSVTTEGGLGATCRLHAGKLEADVAVDGERAVFAILSGSASAEQGRSGGAAVVEEVASPIDPGSLRTIARGLTLPEGGDVDITSEEVLVVVGRGIESADHIGAAQALAEALGGSVAASRPIIDQGWLPKSRQIGKSGLTVKPRIYLSLGVSGAPEHLEGMKGAETIIAVNTDPQAPIFSVAHYGWVGDLFDLLPELVDRLEGD